MPLERTLLPPLLGLANGNDDRVLTDAARTPRRRAAIRIAHHLGARVARIASGAFERDDLRAVAHAAAELFIDLLQARPVLAGDLHGVARRVDVGPRRAFGQRPGLRFADQ